MELDRGFKEKNGVSGSPSPRAQAGWLGVVALGCALAFAACDSSVTLAPIQDGSVGDGRSSSGSSGTSSGSSGSGSSSSSGSSSGSSGSSSGSSGSSTSSGSGGATDSGLSDADAATLDETDSGPADSNATDVLNPLCSGDAALSVDSGIDCCLNGLKTQPGICGCAVLDTDTDGDGVPDCIDGCPKDRTRTTPGPCGCGAAAESGALCLAHRYSFNGTGTTITDTAGGANGTAVNTTLTGTGSIALLGAAVNPAQYVSLPAGLISSLGNSATFEAWVTWTGGGPWQRLFDFGSSDQPADAGMPGFGVTYIFVTPINSASFSLRTAFTLGGPGGESTVSYIAALPAQTVAHVAVVVDGVARTMTLYQNGVNQLPGGATFTTLGGAAPPSSLSGLNGLNDVNNWLGRSQFATDPAFAGSITEFRIYSATRTAAQVMASFTAGPDALPAQ
jgi:concanavalin A-like lectin/glucanase superfamily protein